MIPLLSALTLGAAAAAGGSSSKIDHEAWTRIENVVTGERLQRVFNWWFELHHRLWKAGDRRPSYQIFQDLLGQQQTTVVFLHRNRVWTCPEEGWTLYVDKRGPALHVPCSATEEQAWAAFLAFSNHMGGS